MSQSVIKTATQFSGLATYPNILSQVQPGALSAASNVNVDKAGTLSVRRGMQAWSNNVVNTKQVPARLFQVENAIFGFLTSDGLPSSSGYLTRYDGGGSGVGGISTLLAPPPSNAIHSFQANNNTFLSTDDGIYKLMALYSGASGGDVVPAGVPFALDTQAILAPPAAGATGFLAGGYATAYRVVWGYTDPQGNVTLGAPSPATIVSNPVLASGTSSTGTVGVQQFTVALGYTVTTGVSNLAIAVVQGSAVATGTITLVVGSPTAVVTLDNGQSLPYFGAVGAAVTVVFQEPITAVSGSVLTTNGFKPTALPTGLAIYAPYSSATPASLLGASVTSTISSTTATSITVAGGTWSPNTLVGILLPATIAVAQTNVFKVNASANAPAVNDYLAIPGVTGTLLVTAVSGTSPITVTLAAFPVGIQLTSNTAAQIYRAQNVQLAFTVPSGINALTSTTQPLAVFYQVYRSYVQAAITLDVAVSPTDNMQMAYQAPVTGAFIAGLNNLIVVRDIAPDGTLGTALYTSPNQLGIIASQYPLPVASDALYYSNSLLMANCYLPAAVSGQLLGVGGSAVSNISWTIGSLSVTVPSTAGMAVGGRLYSSGSSDVIYIAAIINSTTIQQQAAATNNGSYAATYIPPGSIWDNDNISIGAIGFQAKLSPSASTDFQISQNASYTAAQNINATVTNLVRAVNKQYLTPTGAGNTTEQIVMFSTSSAAGQPGLFTLQVSRGLGTITLQQSEYGAVFGPGLVPFLTGIPFGPTTYSPTNLQNALFFSASNQPEAVPLTNYIQVGSPNYPIQRIVAIPGSCLIFKPDGVYQLTGSSPSTFAAQLFNNTIQLLANESVAVLQSSVMAYTTQGVVTITAGNVQIVSMAINDDLAQLYQLPAFASTAFGVAQERERRYLLFAPSTAADTLPTQAFAYNVVTNAWTKWALPGGNQTCGLTNIADQLLYVGCTASAVLGTPAVFRERAGTTTSAYGDESFTASAGNWGQNQGSGQSWVIFSYPYSYDFSSAGTVLIDSAGVVYPVVTTLVSGGHLFAFVNGTYTFPTGNMSIVQGTAWSFSTVPIGMDDNGTVKQFQEFAFDAVRTTLGSWTAQVASDFYADPTSLLMVPYAAAGAGISAARQLVPRGAARGHTLQITASGTVAQQTLNLVGLTLQWVPQQTMRSK